MNLKEGTVGQRTRSRDRRQETVPPALPPGTSRESAAWGLKFQSRETCFGLLTPRDRRESISVALNHPRAWSFVTLTRPPQPLPRRLRGDAHRIWVTRPDPATDGPMALGREVTGTGLEGRENPAGAGPPPEVCTPPAPFSVVLGLSGLLRGRDGSDLVFVFLGSHDIEK